MLCAFRLGRSGGPDGDRPWPQQRCRPFDYQTVDQMVPL